MDDSPFSKDVDGSCSDIRVGFDDSPDFKSNCGDADSVGKRESIGVSCSELIRGIWIGTWGRVGVFRKEVGMDVIGRE